ncbi:MAG: hypothetical protein KME06_05095 [Kastovskya adunca ATA6-11-RM4]|jgi:DNA repair exonuclease SbcCD ATPase subunit|nr:hypothetical protein [Kastovskya adunca ATA6-11-RM4]
MAISRNVNGLRQNAQKKRQEALEKVEKGIRELLKDGKPINFNTVAQTADVSKAFLYKELEIKERIEQLRQQRTKQKPEPKQRASDASKDTLIRTLRERIKQLESEVKMLRKQNEVAYGQVIEVNSLRQQIGRLQAENDRLKQQVSASNTSQIFSSDISDLEAEVRGLGVELNSTIRRLLRDAPSDVVAIALESLREAVLKNRANNPSGFFVSAVSDHWKPNEVYEQKVELDLFNDWYPLAKSKKIVEASMFIDGVQCVLTADDGWIPFEEMLAEYPLEKLE